MRADELDREARVALWFYAHANVEEALDMLTRVRGVLERDRGDAHYAISKMWEAYRAIVTALTTLGVDVEELQAELQDQAAVGRETYRSALTEDPAGY
jgi:hypothetical protein